MKKRAYKVTVQEALAKGSRNLETIPDSLSLFSYAILIPSTLAVLFSDVEGILPHVMLIIGLALQIAAIFWRGRHITDWKIWALENVQDVHRLYQIAIRKRMIYERDSWMNIFEVMNNEKQKRLNALEKRLDEPRMLEGPSKAWEAYSHEIYYKNDGADWWHGKTAPIQLNQQSLTIQQNPPIPWEHITNIQIIKESIDENPDGILIIDTDLEPPCITLQIRGLQMTNDEIEQLLYDYWAMGREQKSESPSETPDEIVVPTDAITTPPESPTPTLSEEPPTYSISVDEAIRLGSLHLIYIPGVMAFLAGSICFYFFLATKSDANEAWPGPGTLLFLLIPVVSWLAAVLWRSFNSAQWKIEVLQHVENAQQAFDTAIQKGMIYPPGSIFNSLEFQWSFQSEALTKLEPRLAELQLKPAIKKRKSHSEQQIGYSIKVAAMDAAYFLAVMAFLAYRTIVDFDTFKPVFYLTFLLFFLLFNRAALMRWATRIGKAAPIQFDRTTLTLEGYEPVPWQQITQIFTEPNHEVDSTGNLLIVEIALEPYRMVLDLSDVAGKDEETVQLILDYWEAGKTKPLKKIAEKHFQ